MTIHADKGSNTPAPLSSPDLKSLVKLVLMSTGVKLNEGAAKKGFVSLPQADLYIDCRGIKEKGLHAKGTGADVAFQEAVQEASQTALEAIYALIVEGAKKIPDRRGEKAEPFKEPFRVCFFCAWGIHRSVATKHLLGRRLKMEGWQVAIENESDVNGYYGLLM